MSDPHLHMKSISQEHRAASLITMLVLLLCTANPAIGQNASAKLDTNDYRIGEWIPLHLTLSAPQNANIIWPLIDMHIDELEVLNRTDVDTTFTDAQKTLQQSLTLTVFDTGYYPIPSFDFIVDGDTISTVATILQVHGVELDSLNSDLRPIKDPFDSPVTLKEMLPYILGGFGLIGLGLLAFFFLQRKKPEAEVVKVQEIIIPAHEWALGEMDRLKAEGVWEKGEIKAYYIRLTDIFRQYIELRYQQPAMESTTDEIMDRLALLSLPQTTMERTKSTLVLSDLVKFAKAKPLATEHEQSFETIFKFIKSTAIAERKESES